MNSKFLKGAGCLAIVLALTACSSEENMGMEDNTPVAIQFSAGIDGAQTRAVGTTWDAGDFIGISCTSTGSTNYTNMKYATATSGTSGAFSYDGASTGIFFKDNEAVTFSAYYPFMGTEGTSPGGIDINTSDQSKSKEFDFLFAEGVKTSIANATNNSVPVNFNFKHKMCKLVLKIKTDINDFSEDNVKNGTYYFNFLHHEGRLNPQGDVISITQDYTNPWKINAAPEFYSDANSRVLTYSIILLPQTLQSRFMATINNADYTSGWINYKMAAGNSYEYTITVKKTGVTVSDCTISPWGTGATGSGSVTIEEPVDLTAYADEVYTVPQNASVVIDGKGTELGKRIIIKDGAQVTLKNVKLNEQNITANAQKPVIEVLGTATITISGKENVIKSCMSDFCSAICVTGANATLTINGTLEDKLILDASASANGIGIGATNNANLIINGGTITATGGWSAAGIGSNSNFICGDITINGGNITANAGQNAAAIGGGDNAGQCGNISITGGTIIAKGYDGKYGGVGIGSGTGTGDVKPTCRNISISGGDVTATGGGGEYGGAGIGAGPNSGKCGDISITGGKVTATGKSGTSKKDGFNDSGAGIGASGLAECGDITISGTNTIVIATAGGDKSYDIGSGYSCLYGDRYSRCGDVVIADEANVTAPKVYKAGYNIRIE